MGGPVTTNPWLIALINMTIVFGVLASLGVVISIINLIDPTKVKKAPPAPAAVPAPAVQEATPVAAQNDDEIVAVIAAAVAAYGYGSSQIASIKPTLPSRSWTYTARNMAVNTRNEMF